MSELEYSTCYESMRKLFDEKTRPFAMKAHSVDEYGVWRERFRLKLREITGIDTVQSCTSGCEIVSRVKEDGYTRVKALLATEPDVRMPMYILIPDGITPNERRACVIAPHGHGAAGKESVAGVRNLPEITEQIDRYHCDYGLQLVRMGYVAFCPDARGSGERREEQEQGNDAKSINSSSCDRLSLAYYSLGRSLTGMWVWDLMRLIDYIGTLDYCDAGKIACCGFSGGGLQALWLAALDDRVKCAVISGYFHSYRDSLLQTNFCGCNFVPHLWECAELGDIAALIAPRPLLIESGDRDPLAGARGLTDVCEQLETVRNAYSLFGREESLTHHVFSGGHRYNGEKTGAFLQKYL
jgi:dienelactone hydrolase